MDYKKASRYLIEGMIAKRENRAVLQAIDRKDSKIKYFGIQINDDGTITTPDTGTEVIE